jgi:hypothetical protein
MKAARNEQLERRVLRIEVSVSDEKIDVLFV